MRNLAIRNSVMGGSALPYTAKIEYLAQINTTTGYGKGAYINLNLPAKDGYKITCEMSWQNTAQDLVFCGSHSPLRLVYIHKYPSTWYTSWRSDADTYETITGSTVSSSTAKYKVEAQIKSGNSYLRVNDVLQSSSTANVYIPSGYDNRILLFARSYLTGGSIVAHCSPAKSRCYNCKVEYNGEMIRDMFPVRVGSVGYMYDSISEQLFGNLGTGAFVVGPDKVSQLGGGSKCRRVRRSYRRSYARYTRFCSRRLWKEVA